jgi:UPF0755 protein
MDAKKKKIWMIAGGSAAGLIIILFGIFYYIFLSSQFHPAKTTYLLIDKNDNIDSVYHKIQIQTNPGHIAAFYWLARKFDYKDHIRTGRFAVHRGDNSLMVFNRLYKGRQTPVDLTIGSVRTIDKMAAYLGTKLMADSAEIEAKLTDTAYLAKLGYTPENVPALFIPNTYQMYWDISIDDFFKRMVKENKEFWDASRLSKAAKLGLTPIQVSIFASIIEEETNNKAEKPMVAGMYLNRYNAGMPLQADPTIKFAIKNFDLHRVSGAILHVNSPYNTYTNIGLPPGPIRNPTTESIDAVLNRTKHNFFFMCAKNDFSGTHAFATTFAEHQQNARKYWKALNEKQIYK